jgi:hypothetical protein
MLLGLHGMPEQSSPDVGCPFQLECLLEAAFCEPAYFRDISVSGFKEVAVNLSGPFLSLSPGDHAPRDLCTQTSGHFNAGLNFFNPTSPKRP